MSVWCAEDVDRAAYRHTLQETNVKAELVPLDGRADDADKREGDARLPVLWRLEDEVVERLADLPAMSKRDATR